MRQQQEQRKPEEKKQATPKPRQGVTSKVPEDVHWGNLQQEVCDLQKKERELELLKDTLAMENKLWEAKMQQKKEEARVAVLEVERKTNAQTKLKEGAGLRLRELQEDFKKAQEEVKSMVLKQKATEERVRKAEFDLGLMEAEMERLKEKKAAAEQRINLDIKQVERVRLAAEDRVRELNGQVAAENTNVKQLEKEYKKLLKEVQDKEEKEASLRRSLKQQEVSEEVQDKEEKEASLRRSLKQQEVSEAERKRKSEADKAKEKMTEMETKKDSAADDATLKAAKAKEKRKMETKKNNAADDATLKAAKRQRSDDDTKRTKDPERQKKKDDGEKPKTKEAQSTGGKRTVQISMKILRRLYTVNHFSSAKPIGIDKTCWQ